MVASHAHVQFDGTPTTDALDFALLQYAQQLGLQAEIHFRDFVQQQSAAVGLFELAGLALNGTSEGALLMAEQRRLKHILGDGGAVNGDKGFGRTRRLLMNVARQHLLAGAAFTADQNGGIGGRHLARQRQHLLAGRLDRYGFVLHRRRRLSVTFDQFDQLIRFERLDQIVDRTGPAWRPPLCRPRRRR